MPAGTSLARRAWTFVWDSFRGVMPIVVAIVVLKSCVVDQYSIPSGSMEPTLHGDPRFLRGDRVLVNKWWYGPRVPLTTWRLSNWNAPQRWDVVVFRPVVADAEFPALIKRVAALPGERVSISEGHVWIDGERVPFPEDMPEDVHYVNAADLLHWSIFAENQAHRTQIEVLRQQYPYRYGCSPEAQYSVVPEGHVFVLGDNSLYSIDSRVYGWVPIDHLYGRAFAIWWPIGHWRDFTGFSSTWTGRLGLLGLPALLIGFEMWAWRSRRRKRKASAVRQNPSA